MSREIQQIQRNYLDFIYSFWSGELKESTESYFTEMMFGHLDQKLDNNDTSTKEYHERKPFFEDMKLAAGRIRYVFKTYLTFTTSPLMQLSVKHGHMFSAVNQGTEQKETFKSHYTLPFVIENAEASFIKYFGQEGIKIHTLTSKDLNDSKYRDQKVQRAAMDFWNSYFQGDIKSSMRHFDKNVTIEVKSKITDRSGKGVRQAHECIAYLNLEDFFNSHEHSCDKIRFVRKSKFRYTPSSDPSNPQLSIKYYVKLIVKDPEAIDMGRLSEWQKVDAKGKLVLSYKTDENSGQVTFTKLSLHSRNFINILQEEKIDQYRREF